MHVHVQSLTKHPEILYHECGAALVHTQKLIYTLTYIHAHSHVYIHIPETQRLSLTNAGVPVKTHKPKEEEEVETLLHTSGRHTATNCNTLQQSATYERKDVYVYIHLPKIEVLSLANVMLPVYIHK